jgi:putative transposase
VFLFLVAAGFSLRVSMPIREKQHRLDRQLYRGLITVSFTLCIQDRKQAFVEPDIVDAFTDRLRQQAAASSCRIPAYCFMPDHLHLIVQGTSADSDAWKTLVSYKQRTGFWLASNRPEIKWQKDFYDHVLRSDEKVAVQVRYILDNPVRKGFASSWQDYPHKGAIGYELNDVLNGII